MKWLTLECSAADFAHMTGNNIFFPSSVQPTQWSSDLNDQKWVKKECLLPLVHVNRHLDEVDLFLLLQLWWHRTGDPKLWNAATWAAVPEGTTAGLQLCEFTLQRPPTWIKQSVWFCLPRHTELKLIYIKSPETSTYILHPTSYLVVCLFVFLDILFFLFAVNSWALVISVLILMSQTAHLLVLLAKQLVEIVAIFKTNVRGCRTDYRVNHLPPYDRKTTRACAGFFLCFVLFFLLVFSHALPD